MRTAFVLALGFLHAAPLAAAELAVDITIPRLSVAEYHRPYVAVWVETPGHDVAADLAVWYDLRMADDEGEKWLKDMRQWWRRSGRGLDMPVDAVSAATRPPGEHTLRFATGEAPLGELPAGDYRLVVEAAREVGGRELLRVPFTWPPAEPVEAGVAGDRELGTVTLRLAP